jgi:L-cysteine:1D-myo-inositol 2-amino-2-deoxy-alpha-D-glucopyranoside ligase
MKLYNTLTKSIELFTPLEEKKVKMYVCGITPYDTTHLGHAFTYMSFDVLKRVLQSQDYQVTYVQNVTDIDDDILKRAKKLDQDWKELGKFWTEKFLRDLKALNIQMPDHYVKATETIPTIIKIITTLETKGYAYENKGNVYFRIQNDSEYGKLSKYREKQMIKLSKERGADPNDPLKEHPLDFIMWQKSLPDEPYWEAKWSKGRPGWHIECSAMIYKYLYNNIDIHGGGTDLIFPHHESEIAQSEQFTGVKPFVNYWMHTGAVGYEGEKMSKSLGNLIMISDLLKTYSANGIRYLLLSHHYREPWEYKEEELKSSEQKISEFKSILHDKTTEKINDKVLNEFNDALQNDLNTPAALQLMNKTFEKKDIKTLKTMTDILGFSF